MTEDRSPRLLWTDDGAPRSGRFGDVYFSRDDGLAESRAVFLQGCDLPEAWAGRQGFTVAELGFGTGLNIAAVLDLWRRTRPEGARLNVFSVEGFPLTVEEARRALSNWPELAEPAEALLEAWPEATPGFHRVDLPGFDAVLDLAVGDVGWALDQWSGTADAWFLDGFSPALNPDMWSPQVLDRIAERSAPDARLATFTVAGAVRRGLSERGFVVDKRPGHGRKRERLEARRPGPPQAEHRPQVAIVGAGIAGASVARALAAAGLTAVVIEADRPGAGGSGFPAGLATPRLDAGDAAIAGLYAQALERARHLYDATPGAVLGRGVLQLPQAERDRARFAKIADQPVWREGAMTVIDAAAAEHRLGEAQADGGLMMADARVVRPAAILEAWLEGTPVLSATVASIRRAGDRWDLLDAQGRIIVTTDAVVAAAGWGVEALLETGGLSPVRGQADWRDGASVEGAAWGGYVAPTVGGLLYGATHTRGDVDLTPRDADSRQNLETLKARLPQLAARLSQEGGRRVAVRATTRDRLIDDLRETEHVLALGCGGSSVRFRPALTISQADLDRGLDAVERCVARLQEHRT